MEMQRKRPKRLWIAAVLNFFRALLALGFLIFILFVSADKDLAGLIGWGIFIGPVLSVALIAGTTAALSGSRWGRWAMLSAAVLFYGVLIGQNLLMLADLDPASDIDRRFYFKAATNAIRPAIELAINCWALMSAKTKAYFEQSGATGVDSTQAA